MYNYFQGVQSALHSWLLKEYVSPPFFNWETHVQIRSSFSQGHSLIQRDIVILAKDSMSQSRIQVTNFIYWGVGKGISNSIEIFQVNKTLELEHSLYY